MPQSGGYGPPEIPGRRPSPVTNPPGNPSQFEAFIDSVDNPAQPKICAVLVENRLPPRVGFTLPAGTGAIQAAGTSTYNGAAFTGPYYNSPVTHTGGSRCLVDLNTMAVVAILNGVSIFTPSSGSQLVASHVHTGATDANGNPMPAPVDMTNHTTGNLPFTDFMTVYDVAVTDPHAGYWVVPGTGAWEKSGSTLDLTNAPIYFEMVGFNPNATSEAFGITLNSNSHNSGVGPSGTAYRVYVDNSGFVRIYKFTGGTGTQVFVSPVAYNLPTKQTDHSLKVAVVGQGPINFYVQYDNSPLLTYSDNSGVYYTSGFYGMDTDSGPAYVRSFYVSQSQADILALGLMNVINVNGQLLINPFPGGTVKGDGTITNVDGIAASTTYSFSLPLSFDTKATFVSGATTLITGFLIGSTNNGYEVSYTSGTLSIFTWITGTKLSVASLACPNTTGPHTLSVFLGAQAWTTTGNPVQIVAVMDGNKVLRTQDTTVTLSAPIGVTVYTGGSSGTIFAYQSETFSQASSTQWNQQGSVVSIADNTFSYTSSAATSTTGQIIWTWLAFLILFPDGTQMTVPASTVGTQITFSGLNASTTYYFELYYDFSKNAVAIAGPYTTSGVLANQLIINADTHIPIKVDAPAFTPAVGGRGGGGGGGHITCPATGQVLQVWKSGADHPCLIPAECVRKGDYVRGLGYGEWNLVTEVRLAKGLIVRVKVGDTWFDVDIDHLWLRAGGDPHHLSDDWSRTYDLSLNTLLQSMEGPALPVRALEEPREGMYVMITCETHTFRLGELGAHNMAIVTN